jgi:hypothetical protein
MPYSDPKYPIVNPSPSVDDCVKSMRIRDYFFLGGTTAATWSYGYIFGKPARMPTASTAAALGLTFAGMAVLQDTRARLMGYGENAKEVATYGLHPVQPERPVQKDPRFPIATGAFSPAIKPNPKFNNHD